jgi:NAD(P)H-flavin reductase
MEIIKAKVLGIKNYTDKGKREFQILRVSKELDFQAGQFVMLAKEGFNLKGSSSLKWTPYSMASSPLQKELEFCYRVFYTGGFTQLLSKNLKEGGELLMKGPYGKFVLDDNDKDKVFVATGAGITPLISMIRTLIMENKNHIKVFYGFRNSNQFLFREELEKYAEEGKIKLFTTISRSDPSWKGDRGYVQKLLEKHDFGDRCKCCDVYICGNPQSVRDSKKILLELGFPKDALKTEGW